jgi:hypothetical protein
MDGGDAIGMAGKGKEYLVGKFGLGNEPHDGALFACGYTCARVRKSSIEESRGHENEMIKAIATAKANRESSANKVPSSGVIFSSFS